MPLTPSDISEPRPRNHHYPSPQASETSRGHPVDTSDHYRCTSEEPQTIPRSTSQQSFRLRSSARNPYFSIGTSEPQKSPNHPRTPFLSSTEYNSEQHTVCSYAMTIRYISLRTLRQPIAKRTLQWFIPLLHRPYPLTSAIRLLLEFSRIFFSDHRATRDGRNPNVPRKPEHAMFF